MSKHEDGSILKFGSLEPEVGRRLGVAATSWMFEMRLSGPMSGRPWTIDPTNQEREGH